MRRGRWRSGGRATGAHLKGMGSYEAHAWGDAIAIAALMHELVGAARARRIYDRIEGKDVWDYEDAMEEQIADFIGRSESQRAAVIRKLPDEVTRVCFMTLSLLGCVRAHHLMELRDRYRELLAPGRGKRETTRGLYQFANEVQRLTDYAWPDEVFRAVDADDEDDEDESAETGAVSGAVRSASLKPTIPPPEPPPEPATSTDVLVTIGTSDTVRASPGSEQGAWKLQLIDPNRGTVVVVLLTEAMARDALVRELVRAAKAPWGSEPTVLVLPKAHRALATEVNAVAGRTAAALMRTGVGSWACMKWPEELLQSIKRELEIVGEPMPTAAELKEMRLNRLASYHGDPTADWQRQRDDVEKWVKKILAHRGRWTGPVASVENPASRALSGERDLKKLRRTVATLVSGNRTPYGDALYGVAEAVLAWRAGELTTEDAGREAGRAFMEYLFRTAHQAGRRGGFHLEMEIERLVGGGSAESELLEAGLLRLLSGPFEAALTVSPSMSQRQWSAYGVEPYARRWINVWWCALEIANQAGLDDQRWLRLDGALADAIRSALGDGVRVLTGDRLLPLARKPHSVAQNWVDTRGGASRSAAEALVSWLSGNGRFADHGEGADDDCTRWGILVAVRGSTEECVVNARAAWAGAAKQVAACLREVDPKGRRPQAPRSLRVSDVAEGFLEPLITTRERLALMAGRSWDADAGRAR